MPFFPTKRFIDSPDSPRFCRSLFFHSAIFQPCPLLLILIHISDSLWSMLRIHASSPTERNRCPHSSSTVAGSLNSPHKHWSNLRQMQPRRPPSTSSMKVFFFKCLLHMKKDICGCILTLVYVPDPHISKERHTKIPICGHTYTHKSASCSLCKFRLLLYITSGVCKQPGTRI